MIPPAGKDRCIGFNGFDLVDVLGQPKGLEKRIGCELAKRIMIHSAEMVRDENLWTQIMI